MFPPVESADSQGLLCYGADYSIETMLAAYRGGIFPWPIEEFPEPLWFAPPRRALLDLDAFHVSHSLAKLRRKHAWTIRFDHDFASVIRACSEPRPDPDDREGEAGTWIVPELQQGFIEMHRAGHAHSVEVYESTADGEELVGGLYGVTLGGYFGGESMFHRRSGASKIAVCALVDHLRERGANWIDCQTLTPLFASFGARLVTRRAFMKRLKSALAADIQLFPTRLTTDDH